MNSHWSKAAVAALLCGLAACGPQSMEIGVRDSAQSGQIERINTIGRHLDRHQYRPVEAVLQSELKRQGGAFGRQHILNELAELYSFYLLDPEAALETDAEILRLGRLADDPSYRNLSSVANNRVLVDPEYRSKYIDVSSDKIIEAAARRTERNRLLLSGELRANERGYDLAFLRSHLRDVREDVERTVTGGLDRRRLISRLIRAEFELARASGNGAVISDGFRLARQENMTRGDFFFDEIDFISLSRYYQQAYERHKDISLMEMSLHIIYLPYTNLRDANTRWRYNKLINESVNALIDANYQQHNFENALYYIALNKSRMVLEEKTRLQGGNLSGAATGGIPMDSETGMPDKVAFRAKLAATAALLDFYVEGSYQVVRGDSAAVQSARADAAGALSGLRDIGMSADTSGPASTAEVLKDKRAFVSFIRGGRVQMHVLDAARLSGIKAALDSELRRLERQYDRADQRRGGDAAVVPAATTAAVRQLVPFDLPAETLVSPDKWLARYPMSHFLGVGDHRVLNLLTTGEVGRLPEVKLVGYFNPTGDLVDSDAEIGPIRSVFPDIQVFSHEQASLEQLRKNIPRNVLHLSMHGFYQGRAPTRSKLLLAGSRKDPSVDDPRALYAADMVAVPQLRDNDLVFTAACQTGLLGSDDLNQNEILGIMRPLLINNNRNIILTLWSVDSQSAGEFVQEFYRQLASSRDIPRAFDAARALLRTRYPATPYLWAPYFLVQNG